MCACGGGDVTQHGLFPPLLFSIIQGTVSTELIIRSCQYSSLIAIPQAPSYIPLASSTYITPPITPNQQVFIFFKLCPKMQKPIYLVGRKECSCHKVFNEILQYIHNTVLLLNVCVQTCTQCFGSLPPLLSVTIYISCSVNSAGLKGATETAFSPGNICH